MEHSILQFWGVLPANFSDVCNHIKVINVFLGQQIIFLIEKSLWMVLARKTIHFRGRENRHKSTI